MFEFQGKRIPENLAELADAKHAALLLWDMENAIAPNAFNYQDVLAKTHFDIATAAEVADLWPWKKIISFSLGSIGTPCRRKL